MTELLLPLRNADDPTRNESPFSGIDNVVVAVSTKEEPRNSWKHKCSTAVMRRLRRTPPHDDSNTCISSTRPTASGKKHRNVVRGVPGIGAGAGGARPPRPRPPAGSSNMIVATKKKVRRQQRSSRTSSRTRRNTAITITTSTAARPSGTSTSTSSIDCWMDRSETSIMYEEVDGTTTGGAGYHQEQLLDVSRCPHHHHIIAGGSILKPPPPPPPPPLSQNQITGGVGLEKDDPSTIDTEVSVTNKEKKRTKKKVSFSTIEIREYKRSPGDNPSVVSGIPLSLGWAVEATHKLSLQDYEAYHPRHRQLHLPSGDGNGDGDGDGGGNGGDGDGGGGGGGDDDGTGSRRRRPLSELRMGPWERMDLLLAWGYSRGELREIIARVDTSRTERGQTLQSLGVHRCLQPFHQIWIQWTTPPSTSTSRPRRRRRSTCRLPGGR